MTCSDGRVISVGAEFYPVEIRFTINRDVKDSHTPKRKVVVSLLNNIAIYALVTVSASRGDVISIIITFINHALAPTSVLNDLNEFGM